MTVVLDSSALLALLKREPGFERVRDTIPQGIVSPIILAECLGKAARYGFDLDLTETRLMATGLRVSEVETADIRLVARLHARRDRDISLADRFCLALAMRLNAPLITGDRPRRDLGLPVELRFIR